MTTCPQCGADLRAKSELAKQFKCGTSVETIHFIDPFIYESKQCLRNQIAVLKSDLVLWLSFWDNMRYADKTIYENICPHVRALKERGLI